MPNPVLEHIDRRGVLYDIQDPNAERSANRVSEFQQTPDDAHYPSEKLVYDQLSALQAAISAASTGKELTANKVTSFQQTPDDAHYPSEKLVKDSLDVLDAKIDNIHVTSTVVVDELPELEDADPGIDYILTSGSGALYYKVIDGAWVMVGGAMAVVGSELPVSGDEHTDYYIQNGSNYLHYRWNGETFYQIGSDSYTKAEIDALFRTVNDTLSTHANRITAVENQIISLAGNTVTDVNGNSSVLTVTYRDGSTRNIAIADTSDKVSDVNQTSTGIEIVYSNGDTKPITISGGGGGSSSGSAVITRITDASVTYVQGSSCPIEYNFEARDSAGDLTGNGTATWYVGNVRKATSVAAQGDNEFDIADYLTVGTNNVKVSVSVDTGGDSPLVVTKSWTVSLVNMYLEWNYDDATINTDDTFSIRWTPYGDVLKTTHIIIDGLEATTSSTSRSGVQQVVTLQKLSHGSHMVRLYCTATVGETVITSKSVAHDMIFVDTSSDVPVISSSVTSSQMTQYDTVRIPIVVYTPGNMTSDVTLAVDGEDVATWINVDRSVHYWNYTPSTSGTKSLTITSGVTTKTIPMTVLPLNIDNEEVGGYSFRMKASDITGNEALRNWLSEGVTATFSSNFDWNNGGIQTETDENGYSRQYICVRAGTRMTINYKLFADDATANGKTFKLIFKTTNCREYDAQLVQCFADDIGIQLNAHEAICKSTGTSVSVPYGEDEYIELEFDVYPAPKTENDGNYRYIMAWIDGVITTTRVYNSSDNFTQTTANQQNIVIGSDDCDVYIYMAKAYPMLLTRENHIENFIADAPNAQEMVRRYNRNNILDVTGEIDYEKLAQQNPDCRVWLYDIPRLTQGKKDKVAGCQFQQIWTNGDPYYQLTGTGTMTIQGTSSVDYLAGAANTDINFEGGELRDGNGNDLLDENLETPGFKINDDSEPITYSNTKVNFASCEQVNNMCNAEWYQQFQPYQRKTARDCMEFSMGVQFIHDQSGDLWDDNKYHMYSIANMGNSKKNVHVFHDIQNESEVCIEVNNNLNDQCRMISDDLTNEDWSGDFYFGMRYPDTKNPSQEIRDGWQRFLTWMATSNPNAATNEALSEPVTYGVYTFRGHEDEGTQVLRGTTVTQYAGTYTHDTFNYRMAKMLSECEDYMIMDSVIYHFCMLERHTMVDNVAKNSFWSSRDLEHWDLSKAYDMDTADGNNNEGQMVFDYGNEANDMIGTKTVFNAADAVWFVFASHLYEACQTMFINRESATAVIDGITVHGAWNKEAYHNFLTTQQKKVPERVWVQCYWYDYLRTYEQGINSDWMSFLDGGQKTHQRWHYETFQEAYESSKYRGTACTSQNVTIRGYTPDNWTGVAPSSQVSIKMYNKMYIVIRIDQIYKSVKAERGQTYTIDFSDVGKLNDTVINFYTAQMIQEIGDISPLYPGYCTFSNASRLRSVQIGSAVDGYSNTNLEGVAFDQNPMLEYLYVQNLPNATGGLNLTNCKSLKYLDASGSSFTGYDFATGGALETAYLEAPVSLTLKELYNITDANFHVNRWGRLATLIFENCPNLNSLAMVNNAESLNRARIIGIDWQTAYTTVLNRLLEMIGIDDSGYNTPLSVLSGSVYISGPIRTREIEAYEAWENLEVTYNDSQVIPQYTANYYNADGTLLYSYYVDRGATLIDPVAEGYIETPKLDPSAQYTYSYAGWDDISGTVVGNRTITATYTPSTRRYTVRWWLNAGDLEPAYTSNVEYGQEAVYAGTRPSDTTGDSSQMYKIWTGWDKSTGSIKMEMDVYATWETANGLPEAGTEIKDMTAAQLYGVSAARMITNYAELKDYIDIPMGSDFDFSNVESQTLLSNTYFDGTNGVSTDVQLFNNESPAFTLAIDYEFLESNAGGATLVSCCDSEATSEGFRLYYSGNPRMSWVGAEPRMLSYSSYRNIIVMRHEAGSANLTVYSFNIDPGSYNSVVTAYTLVGGRTPNTDQVLCFGGIKYGNIYENAAKGWVHWCKIWYDDLGEQVCRKIAAWPHKTIRMEFSGANRMPMTDGSGYANISLLANNTLDFTYPMSTNTSKRGWSESEMRTFCDSRVYEGFSYKWQSIMKQVRLRSLESSASSSTVTSSSYVYIPAIAEMNLYSTTDPYNTELATANGVISYFTNNTSRLKFPFVVETRDDAIPGRRMFTSASDPSNGRTLVDGDMWYNSNYSYRYLYLSPDTASKHTRIGNRNISDPNTVFGSMVYKAYDGGVWILATEWYSRTPIYEPTYSTDYYHYIDIYGTASQQQASAALALTIAFCI